MLHCIDNAVNDVASIIILYVVFRKITSQYCDNRLYAKRLDQFVWCSPSLMEKRSLDRITYNIVRYCCNDAALKEL